MSEKGFAKNPLELIGAFDDSLGNDASMKRAFEDYPTQNFQDVTEAIGNLLVESKSACVVLTKQSTLVIAPTGVNEYLKVIFVVCLRFAKQTPKGTLCLT
jgi:hypothetical protein